MPLAERRGLRARFTRSRTRFLSMLGVTNPSPKGGTAESGGATKSVFEHQDRAASNCTQIRIPIYDSADVISDDSTPLSGSPPSRTKSTPPTSDEQTPYRTRFVERFDLDENRFSEDADLQSRPGLVKRLSRKLSTKISKSTLVHRPYFRFGAKATKCIAAPTSQGSTESQGSCDEEQLITVPSITTVEHTANAKMYFEHLYNPVRFVTAAREERQQDFAEYLCTLNLPEDKNEQLRENFFQLESNYLRQSRALNCEFSRDDAPSRAGYRRSKVLGRGSFGIVQLVRKQDDLGNVPYDISFDAASDSDGFRHCPNICLAGRKKDVFAMKIINKSQMIQSGQEGHVRAERDILVQSSMSPWVVSLMASFQDQENLYLVLDYMIGGDFLGLLIKHDVLSEGWTRFYIAEMILCVEEAHKLGWIHRDLKPDNFLISETGHLKIADVGLAFNGHPAHDQSCYTGIRHSIMHKLGIWVDGDSQDQKDATKHKSDRLVNPESIETFPPWKQSHLTMSQQEVARRRFARSFVGTTQYMAPEILKGNAYDGRCDWWSIGIILFECLFGITPFAQKTREDTWLTIIHHAEVREFPVGEHIERVSRHALDLIFKLLTDKQLRLGSAPYKAVDDWMTSDDSEDVLFDESGIPYFVYENDADEVKAHSFFDGVDWASLLHTSPPFVPRVKGWGDTTYFSVSQEDIRLMEDPNSGIWNHEPKASPCPKFCFPQSDDPRDSDYEEIPDLVIPTQRSHTTRISQMPYGMDLPLPDPPQNADRSDSEEKELRQIILPKRRRRAVRARDKILRDEAAGAAAMKIRKKSAFAGYSYVRPQPSPRLALVYPEFYGREVSDIWRCSLSDVLKT